MDCAEDEGSARYCYKSYFREERKTCCCDGIRDIVYPVETMTCCSSQYCYYRIIESFRLERPFRSLNMTVNLMFSSPPVISVPKHRIYTPFK